MAISELQLALVGVGVVAVAGVWAHNKWQERRHRQLAERILHGGGRSDVLLEDEAGASHAADDAASDGPPVWARTSDRLEPVIAGGATEPSLEPPQSPSPSSRPSEQAQTREPEMPSSRAADQPDSPWLDAVADGIGGIEFIEPVAAPALWAAQAEWVGHLSKPLHWVGRTREGWQRIGAHDAGRYDRVCVAQQLADRRGAVSEAELTVFVDGVRHLAAQFGGVATLPAVADLLGQAHVLDDFCAGVDVQLGINIVDPGGMAFAGTKLRGLAEAAGMSLQDDGRFHAVDEDDETLYTLSNAGIESFAADTLRSMATHGVTLSLDVPNVADGARVFDRMVMSARQFAQALGGVLVDAQRAPLTEPMVAGIRARIEQIQAQMAQRQIIAGSVRARRLFS